MGNLEVNTDNVQIVTGNLETYNNKMRDGIQELDTAIRKLNSAWDGQASNAAINSFWSMKSSFCNPRYTVIKNYANYLRQQVNIGYTTTESLNKSLAEAFK